MLLYVNNTPVQSRTSVRDVIRQTILDPQCRIRLIEFRKERVESHNGHWRTNPWVYYIDCYYESRAHLDGQRLIAHQVEPIPMGSYSEATVLKVINKLALEHRYK